MPNKYDAPQRPKKRKNCGKRFTPTAAYPVQLFCKDLCRMECHRNGPANRAEFKAIMRKLAAEEFADSISRLERRQRELEEQIAQLQKRTIHL